MRLRVHRTAVMTYAFITFLHARVSCVLRIRVFLLDAEEDGHSCAKSPSIRVTE